eukprot:2550676-Rhodomonas_salina.4
MCKNSRPRGRDRAVQGAEGRAVGPRTCNTGRSVAPALDRNLVTAWTGCYAGQCHLGIEHTRGCSPLSG